ncbi:MAG: hypothetical protein LBK68_01640 [Candidatus Margulisbacteria bacterium]|jgi:hypothetical protein|nr:hypothetical protein [Candidatus Margulisiibacteriota bacterium]
MSRIFDTKIASGERLLASDMLDLTFFPVGMIMLMDGSWLDGRGGWYICDGQKKNIPGRGEVTMPDLRDRFIKGGATSGGAGGGTATLTVDNLPSHNHTLGELTISGGEHSHGVGTLAASSSSASHSHDVGTLAAASGSATHSHGNGTLAVTITGGTHGHTVTDPGHTHSIKTYERLNGNGNNYSYWEGAIDGNTGRATTGITIANTTGSHAHTATVSGSTANDGAAHGHGITGSTGSDNATHGHSITGNTGAAGGSPTISGGAIGNTGSGTAFDVVPAYYTVIYIKKMV